MTRIDAGTLAERIVARVRVEIAGYGRLPRDVVDGQVMDVARSNVELLVGAIHSSRAVTETELEPFRASAHERASQGMSLEDVLHAYRLGGRLVWEELIAAARPDEHGALPALAGLVMDYLDRVSTAVANAYLEERQHLVSDEEHRLRVLLEALCGEEPIDSSERRQLGSVGLAAGSSYRPFAATVPGEGAPAHSRLAGRLRGHGILAVSEGDRVFGVMAVDHQASIGSRAGEEAMVAVGDTSARPELEAGLEEARLAADLGVRTGRSGVFQVSDLIPELLLARSPRLAEQLGRRALRPLLTGSVGRRPDLLETLRALFAAGLERRQAAASLHIHPNTLDYRLRRISQLTGLSLTRPRDIACLELSLIALSLEATTDAG
ncbi:MAG: helix-turn-helix domain-containing protein [Solirubrobacteraceae bacterium]